MAALRSISLLSALFSVAGATRLASRGWSRAFSAPSRPRSSGFVRPLEFKHRLRVCNAYPLAAALDIFRGEHERLTAEGPMPYETCRDFVAPLQAGDKLEFTIGESSTGTFSVSELPNSDAVLLLVVQRHDALSTAVSFESHIFANSDSAQVAVIDTYKGEAIGKPTITDAEVKPGKSARKEELRYDSVVAINSGKYKVELDGANGTVVSSREFVALPHESYVLLRTGIEAKNGKSYPEDVVVFPRSSMQRTPSSANSLQASMVLLALALGTMAA